MRKELKALTSQNKTVNNLKRLIKGVPLIGSARKLAGRLAFRGSTSYWNARYRSGGTSGAGSYGQLAEFKAAVLNEFVRTKNIRTVIELGCGDGAQLELARYAECVGIDVATASIERCSARFGHDLTKRFYLADALPKDLGTFDLALSLDVIYHLVEDSVFDSYMRTLFARSHLYVVIYASNYDAPVDAPHVRHRRFTNWIAQNAPTWELAAYVPNRFPFDPSRPDETSSADFYFFARQAQ